MVLNYNTEPLCLLRWRCTHVYKPHGLKTTFNTDNKMCKVDKVHKYVLLCGTASLISLKSTFIKCTCLLWIEKLTRSATFARSIIVLMSLLHSMKVRRRFLPKEYKKKSLSKHKKKIMKHYGYMPDGVQMTIERTIIASCLLLFFLQISYFCGGSWFFCTWAGSIWSYVDVTEVGIPGILL